MTESTSKQRPAFLRLVVGALVLVALTLAGVAAIGQGVGTPRATAQAVSAQPQVALAAPAGSVAAVAQSVGPAVVSVRTNQGLGSGVIYDPSSGYILTNAHV